MVDIKNDYFDKDRLEDMVGEITIEHDENEDADRHLIGMALQLSQQSEANNRTKYNYKLSTQLDKYNRKHGPKFLECVRPLPTLHPQLSKSSQFFIPKYYHHPSQQSSCSVRCYSTVLHHSTHNFLSNFIALHTVP